MQHPTSSITERYTRLSFSSRSGNLATHSLVSQQLVYPLDIPLARARIRVFTLTEEGKGLLGLDSAESNRTGGPEHRYWAERIAQHLRDHGYQLESEVPVGGGQSIDLVARRDGKRIAFEVETGNSDVAANLRKCLREGLDRVVFATTSAKADAIVRRTVGDAGNAEVLRTTAIISRAW